MIQRLANSFHSRKVFSEEYKGYFMQLFFFQLMPRNGFKRTHLRLQPGGIARSKQWPGVSGTRKKGSSSRCQTSATLLVRVHQVL